MQLCSPVGSYYAKMLDEYVLGNCYGVAAQIRNTKRYFSQSYKGILALLQW
jgi:hypothetical protein